MSSFGAHIPELQLSPAVIRAALKLANLKPNERYLEPGSGEGIGLVIAAKEFGASAHGVEILDHAIAASRATAKRANVDVEIAWGDLQQHDMSSADVVLLHLGPAFHDVLASKLQAELVPTARVVACGWSVAGWHEIDSIDVEGMPIFLYQPNNPQSQIIWNESVNPVESNFELAVATAGVDLNDVTVTVGDTLSGAVQATVWPRNPRRGQRIAVELRWNKPTAAGTIQLVGSDRFGSADRGSALQLSKFG